MKIAVNTRLLLPNRIDGIARFTFETLIRITKQHPEHHFYFIFDRPYSQEFIFSTNITPIVTGPQARHPFLFYWWFEFSITKILKKIQPDLFLSPDGFLSLSTHTKSLPVIHDLNFIHYKKSTPWLVSKYYNYFFLRFAKKAARIATVSQFSANDIAKQFSISGSQIDIVYNGVSANFRPLQSLQEKNAIQKQYANGSAYFISVSSIHPRKNSIGLLKAFELFKEQTNASYKLIFVGEKYYWTKEMKDFLKSMKYVSDVVFTGRASDDVLVKLVAASEAMIYVPFFEGFGIPVLEAFQSKVPVICSNTTSLPEVYGNAALAVDPYKPNEIAQAMLKLNKDDGLKNELIRAGEEQLKKYSWDSTADLLWKSIEKALQNK